MSVSDNLQSVSVKNSGSRSPQIRKVLTETTLDSFRVPWARKDRTRGRPAFLIKNRKNPFQGGKRVENGQKCFSQKFSESFREMAHDIRDIGYTPDNRLIILRNKSITEIGGWPDKYLDIEMDSMVISQDGRYIATRGQHVVYIFTVKKGSNFRPELVNTLRGDPWAIGISPNSIYLFVSDKYSGLEIRELATGKLCKVIDYVSPWIHTGKHLVVSNHVYDMETFELKYKLPGEVLQGGTSWKDTVILWTLYTIRMFKKGVLIGEIHIKDIPALPRGVSSTLEKVLFSPCGRYIALSVRGEIYISLRVNADVSDIQNWIRGEIIENIPIMHRMAFSRDGKYLATSSYSSPMTMNLLEIFSESRIDSVLCYLLYSGKRKILSDPRLWTAIRG